MSLQLHHFFVFVSRDAPVVDHLVQTGFLEGSRNTHPGQGTANRRIFFQNGMLEFIWVNNLDDIKSPTTAPTRLFERSQYESTGFSPFGICLCPSSNTTSPVEQPFQGWPYYPKYLPAGLVIWEADNDTSPSEPMIFYLSFARPYGPEIAEKEPIIHPNGAHKIEQITVTMKSSPKALSDAAKKLAFVSGITLLEGSTPHAEIAIKGSKENIVLNLTPWCPIEIAITP